MFRGHKFCNGYQTDQGGDKDDKTPDDQAGCMAKSVASSESSKDGGNDCIWHSNEADGDRIVAEPLLVEQGHYQKHRRHGTKPQGGNDDAVTIRRKPKQGEI